MSEPKEGKYARTKIALAVAGLILGSGGAGVVGNIFTAGQRSARVQQYEDQIKTMAEEKCDSNRAYKTRRST